jgi:hypothetical protein
LGRIVLHSSLASKGITPFRSKRTGYCAKSLFFIKIYANRFPFRFKRPLGILYSTRHWNWRETYLFHRRTHINAKLEGKIRNTGSYSINKTRCSRPVTNPVVISFRSFNLSS